MRLGIFGGTFDPPHLGHLILAAEAQSQLALDRVLWVPAGQSPFKMDCPLTPIALRLAMVEAAIAGQPTFGLSRVDVDRPPPHYTVDTVTLLAQANPEASWWYLMGADTLRDLPRWRRPQVILEYCRLAVAPRPGVGVKLAELERELPGLENRVDWLDTPLMDIAARELRSRVRDGRPIRYLVPEAVRQIILHKGLYQ